MKLPLIHLVIVSMETPLNCFSTSNNELVCGQPLMLITPGNIFLKIWYNT